MNDRKWRDRAGRGTGSIRAAKEHSTSQSGGNESSPADKPMTRAHLFRAIPANSPDRSFVLRPEPTLKATSLGRQNEARFQLLRD
jgi:hypothetical protein